MDNLYNEPAVEKPRTDRVDSPDGGTDRHLSLVHLLSGTAGKPLDTKPASSVLSAAGRLDLPELPSLAMDMFGFTPGSLGKPLEKIPVSADDLALSKTLDGPLRTDERRRFRPSEGLIEEAPERRPGRARDYSVPPEMKYGAAFNAWDRVTPIEQRVMAQKINDLRDELLSQSASIRKTEKTSHGFVIKRDTEGRVVSLEKPDKNMRMHFKYDGKSDNVIGMVTEDTRTKEKKTFLAVHTSKEEAIGQREWIALDSKGRREHHTGDITVGKRGGHSVHLEPVGKVPEKIERPTLPKPPKDEPSRERERLERVAEKRFTKPEELEEYKKGLEKFQKVAKEKGLPDKEVAAFFKESARLLEPTYAKLGGKERTRVAMEALKQATDPTSIDQGKYKTCNVTSVEVCMYSKNPSKVMKAITDVALTGKFKTADGDVIVPPKSTLDPDTRRRTLASQIFQTLAVNTHWNGKQYGPDRKEYTRGDITYDHAGAKAGKGDTGQRITATDSKGKRVVVGDGPSLGTDDYPEIYRRIAGTKPETLSLRFGKEKGPEGVAAIHSQEAFHNKLTELSKKPGGFPVTLRIHTSNKPFWEDSGRGKEPGAGATLKDVEKTNKVPGGWHVVTIHGYDSKTGEVKVDNQWGRSADHLGTRGDKGPIKIDDLFKAMRVHKERIEALGWTPKKIEKKK